MTTAFAKDLKAFESGIDEIINYPEHAEFNEDDYDFVEHFADFVYNNAGKSQLFEEFPTVEGNTASDFFVKVYRQGQIEEDDELCDLALYVIKILGPDALQYLVDGRYIE